MGHQDKQADVESLQKGERRRGRCLSACLVVSTFALFVAVAALAVCGAMVVRELRAELQKPHEVPEPWTTETLAGRRASPTFKVSAPVLYSNPSSSSKLTSALVSFIFDLCTVSNLRCLLFF